MKQQIFINLYRAGFYHRAGKPNTTNLHGGDVYVTEQAALENAEPDRGYITTIPAMIDLPEGVTLLVNGPDSVPTPLSVTRSNMSDDWRLPVWTVPAEAVAPSLDVGDGHYGVSYEEWRAKHGSPALAYKPAHGGYSPPVPYNRIPQP